MVGRGGHILGLSGRIQGLKSLLMDISWFPLFFLSHIIFMRISNYIADSREAEMNHICLSVSHRESERGVKKLA